LLSDRSGIQRSVLFLAPVEIDWGLSKMGCKILLADDSITIQKVVNLTFDDEGIEVVAVSNGDHAERKLGEVNPDLVLADIFMPGKNGYELCESIKQNPQFSNIPVVLLVGAFEPFDQNEAHRVGADDHLTKPFESRKLVETVRRLISIREQNRPQQPPAVQTPQQASAEPEDKGRGATDNLDDRSEKTTDPLDAKPFSQSFDLDLSEPPAAQVTLDERAEPGRDGLSGATDAVALNENAPLDLDYSPSEQARSEQVRSEQARNETAVGDFHYPGPEQTGDLSTEAFQDEISFETTPLEDMEFPVSHQTSQVMLETDDTTTQGERLEEGVTEESRRWDGSLEEATPTFSFGESTVDFDKVDGGEPPSSETIFAVDVDASDEAERSINRETREWGKDAPTWQPSLHDSSRMDMTGSTPYAASEASESASATLLAVEDPLGDVLMDETPSEQAVFEGRWQPTETTEEPELNLDFSSPEAAPLPPLSEVAPEYAAHDMPSQAHAVEEPPAEQTPTEGELIFNPEEQREEASQTESEETGSEDSYYGFGQAADTGFDAVSQETATSETSAAEPMPGTGAEFTSSAMWTEEESRFAPIDIEAVPVDEAGLQRASQPLPVEQETGFEFSQIITEEQDEGPDYMPLAEGEREQATVNEPVTASPQPGESQPAPQMIDLSQAAIDEIVRRVVAELSDRVVREIAWEVVPDLVERVVEKLARESISKRM
jgi:CheY-like chemotaxis protein